MKKRKKYFLYLSAFLLINLTCKKLTDDFSTDILLKPAPKNSCWQSCKEPQIDVFSVLDQPYRYLGKGKQAFVFISEDGKHVIKLFKPPFPPWTLNFFGKSYKISLSKLPFLPTLLNYIYADQHEKQKELDFQSYINSFTRLQEETRLQYLHLTTTDHFRKSIKIYDKIGVVRYLDLDNTCFLLQEKADLFYPTLNRCIREKKWDDSKILLQEFVFLATRLIKEGIIKPTTVEKNIGCIGLKPIHIDVGRVLTACDLHITDIEPFDQKIDYAMHHMKKWLPQKSPELVSYLEELIIEQKTQYKELFHDAKKNDL